MIVIKGHYPDDRLSSSHRRLLDRTDTWRTTRRWWSVRLIGQAGKETRLYLCTLVEIFGDVMNIVSFHTKGTLIF